MEHLHQGEDPCALNPGQEFEETDPTDSAYEGGGKTDLVVTIDTKVDPTLAAEIERLGGDMEKEWVSSLNSSKCGPWWNNQINLELFEGPHTPAGKKHLFKKCTDGSGHYHLDGDVIMKFGKTKSHE